MLRVAAFTGGKNVPSARFRVRQYVPALSRLGVELREFRAGFGSYPPTSKLLRPLWGAAAVSERILRAPASFLCDVTLLQREMVSTFLTAEPLTHRPRVLDVDDAIWMRGNGWAAQRLARLCEAVICGNEFLADHFGRWNRNVHVLATAVDTARYCPIEVAPAIPLRRIGWSGESSNFAHLRSIAPALCALFERRKDVILRVVADRRPDMEGIPPDRLEFVRWSPENEVRSIQEMSVGVMPLLDTEWSRGKCSFKLLTYMACGVPVVASPVGMNAVVLAAGGGYGPKRAEEWTEALDCLLQYEAIARRMSRQGREAVVSGYSLEALAPRLARVLESNGKHR